MTQDKKALSEVEQIKAESHHLRGTIAETLADEQAVKFSDDDEQLVKFHGFYQGYNRDTATARKKMKLDKEWEMMLRVKVPGGRITAAQYLALDALTDQFSNGTLRVTSRQGLQYHCVAKGGVLPLIAEVNKTLLTTFGGCGDVVRNVMAVPSPENNPVMREIETLAEAISRETLPKTTAYHELWINGEPYKAPAQDTVDPLYGESWLPRKFKIALAIPEDNTVDALTNDIGLIAVHDGREIAGFNVYIGGGFGMKHGNAATYPRMAEALGYIEKADVMALCKAVIAFQRDHGDRTDRQHARLKYVLAENGMEFCKGKIEAYFGKLLEKLKETPPLQVKDYLGWHAQGDGKWYLGLPVTSGRIKDCEEYSLRKALRAVLETYHTPLILMPTEDVIFYNIVEKDKTAITEILKAHRVPLKEDHTPVELWAMSCVALPTCGKALTEGERARVPIIATVSKALAEHGLEQETLSVRITGCPNGCSRPYTGDIGIVGRAPDIYAVYLGGDFAGTRLSYKVADMVGVEKLGDFLSPFFGAFVAERNAGEEFGNFCHRIGEERRGGLALASGAAKKI